MTSQEGGTGWHVEFYTDPRGRQPAKEYLKTLPTVERATIAHELRLLEDLCPGEPILHARHIRGKLWELKLGGNRLFYFTYIGRRLIILHGYRKKTDRTPEREIATAERHMTEFLHWETRKR